METCKFCLKKKKLIKAHVIPKSLFCELRDEKGHFAKVIPTDSDTHSKRAPDGIYDPNILCHECEKLFDPWDSYIKDLLRDGLQTAKEITIKEGSYFLAEQFDYTKVKLFFLSLLWRSHVSGHDFFRQVDLGPYEKTIKEKIEKNIPGNPEDFSIIMFKRGGEGETKDIMFNPVRGKMRGITVYTYYFAGYKVFIKVCNRKFPSGLDQLCLKPDHWLIVKGNSLTDKELSLVDNTIVGHLTSRGRI